MSDSEKPLKIASFILSGLLIASAILYFVFGQGDPVKAEVVMEYSAPVEFDPSELLATLETLRTDDEFLEEVAVRSGLANESESKFAETVTRLPRSLAFEANLGESIIAIRFTHRKSATAVEVATTAATIAKEKLEQQREERAREIVQLGDAVEWQRKVLDTMHRQNPPNGIDPQEPPARGTFRIVVDPQDHERALRHLKELKAKPEFSIVAIHPATLHSD